MDNLKPFHMMHPHDANEPLHSCLAAPHRWPGAQACCRRCCCAEASALYLTRPPQVIVPATLYLPPTDPLRSLCRRLSTCRRLTPSGHCAGNSRPGRARVLRAPAAALHTTPGRETSALPGGEEQVAARPIPPVVPRPPACHRPPPNARARAGGDPGGAVLARAHARRAQQVLRAITHLELEVLHQRHAGDRSGGDGARPAARPACLALARRWLRRQPR